MRISHISTKTTTFGEDELLETFQTLNRIGHPFNVWVDFLGSKFPVPFMHGTAANAKVEPPVQDLLRNTFGPEVHFA